MEKYKDMKSIFCIAFLILLLPFISCNYKVTHQYSSSTLKEIEKHIDYIDYNKIVPNKKIILTQIQDISDEVKKLVGINQNITSFSFNSFIDNQHLYTITDQGIFFKTNLESNTRKSYNIPEWIGFTKASPGAKIVKDDKWLLDFYGGRHERDLFLFDIKQKTKYHQSLSMTWFEYYGNQRVYCRTGGPSETPHNSILAFDENLEECWFYPPKNTELIRIHNIWEYQGICHLIASRSDDLNNDLIQICLDPKTGKELQKTDLQLDPMPEEFSFNGNTFIQKEEKVWILRADRKGTFIIHYKIKPNHTFEKLWQQYYAEIPRTEESSSYYREGFIKLIDDPDQSKSQIIMPFLYKENKVKKCCLFVIDPSIGSVIWESEGFNCNTLSIYPAKPYLLIDTGVDNDIKIGQKQWHSLISLDDTSGKIVWNKSFPDDYVKQHKNDYFEDNPLLISADKESFLIWHRIDNILYKVYASDGRIESCQFDKQATYFIEFLQADQHTYFQLDTWNKENSELLKSVVYKVE